MAEIENRKGVIYKITCANTGKSYIGQAKTHKVKNNKPYRYGSSGRWSDHKSSASKATTPLAKDISKYGGTAFTIVDLETVDEADLDAREAHWIEAENTLVPNGYNVASHSRNKHNRVSELHNQFIGKVAVAEIHPVHKDGEDNFVYLYLIMIDGSSKRLTFGQNATDTLEQAVTSATAFANRLECEIKNFIGDKKYSPQERTLYQLAGTIREITITSGSNLVAVYIMTSAMKLKKEQLRICFGGKTISKKDAYKKAIEYINTLPGVKDATIIDKLKTVYNLCPQQAAASEGEVTLQGENSVITSGGSVSPIESSI
jgi:hypothetical protein